MSRAYVTVQGDMWDLIAYMQLGDVAYTDMLMGSNRLLLDYYIFPAGITLDLPDIDPDASSSLPPWKKAPQ